MSASDWDRTLATTALTVSESGIFNENVLKFPAGTNELILNDSELALADALVECDFYITATSATVGLELGLRIDTANDNDGYYMRLGLTPGAGHSNRLYKREAGVFTALDSARSFGIAINTRYKFTFLIKGNQMEYQVKRFSDDVITSSAADMTDNTFAGSGTAALYGTFGGGVECYVDNFSAYSIT
jgi:hypothetical protein